MKMKSKKLQCLLIISGLLFGFVSSEVKASSTTEEAFLPVQGFLIHDSSHGVMGTENSGGNPSSIDEIINVGKTSNIFSSLPQTGEKGSEPLFSFGAALFFVLFFLRLKQKRKERGKK